MQGTEGGKSSRQLRKRHLRQLVDEPVDETNDINGSIFDPPSTSNRDEEEDSDQEYRADTSKKKKAVRKASERLPGNEKPVRKRKSAKEASDVSTKEPPKKFSHSTRRRKRIGKYMFLDI